MKNYAVKSDGNVDRNKRIIKAFEALGVEKHLAVCFDDKALRGRYIRNYPIKSKELPKNNIYHGEVEDTSTIITLEELEELVYNLPKEGDEVWVWDDDANTKTRRSYLGVFKDWHMVKGYYTCSDPVPYKHVQKINPNENEIKKLESKIKKLQKELEELK